jgi:thymidylate synthase (FAD)
MGKIEPVVIKIAETKVDQNGVQKLMERYNATDWYKRVRPTQPNDSEFLIELAGRSCFDAETEILTDVGWKRGLELDGEEKIATWNHVARTSEYEEFQLHRYSYKGRMLKIEHQHLDLLVTPEHRLYVQEKRGRRWTGPRIIYAADLGPSRPYRFRILGSEMRGNKPNFVALEGIEVEQIVANQFGKYGVESRNTDEITIPIDPYLRLLGFYLSEGYAHETRNSGAGLALYQRPGAILDEMISVVSQANLPYNTHVDHRNGVMQLRIGGGLTLSRHFKKFGSSAETKGLTREILSLDGSLLRILFDAMWKGDGSTSKGGQRLYHTASEKLAYDVQELLFKIGLVASVNRFDFPDGRVMYLVRELKERNSPIAKPIHRAWVDYDGRVWCVTTHNGVVYVRRNKKPVWCGNCYKSYGVGLNPNVTRIREDSRDYMSNVLAKGDGSILEHATITFAFLNISRITTHEIVRHRAGTAISQESLRYVRPHEISLWIPSDLQKVSSEFEASVQEITRRYHELESKFDWNRMTFEEKKRVTSALRRILPDGIATNMVWTANHRTLRWVIEMRTDPSAEVEIRKVFGQVAEICIHDYPLLYADFAKTQLPDGTFQYTPKYSKV